MKTGSLKKNLVWILSLVLCMSSICVVQADEGDGYGNIVPSIIIPENQRQEVTAYFNLLSKAGDEQTLGIEVRNHADEKQIVEVDVVTATTTFPGVVNYNFREGTKEDDTLIYKMEDLITTESRIEIEANDTYLLELKLKLPEQAFEGTLAGGIMFQTVSEEGTEKTQVGGAGIENEFSRSIAILVRESENQVMPEIIMNSAEAGQSNGKNVFIANLQNIQPAYVLNMRTKSWVTRKGETEKLYEYEESVLEMAPNSNFDNLISLEGDKFAAGDYTYTAEIEGSGETWVLSKDFTVTEEQAKELNAADVTINDNSWIIFVIIGAVLFIILLVVFLVVRSRKKKKEMEMQIRMLMERQKQQLRQKPGRR